ncbi:hypothetical protein LTR37_004900 [Vermiconidia calcicola]|uniref:Uncharacterized protein n=1 Tax=Vermiconidia calcicola TaxID=1690605 RepID=A0ACC3NKY2_9PEZI|nr:hypothetical protein LTR37_004900 [Vermiconidia calcicola]
MDLNGGAGGANAGADLEQIETEQVGFQAASGEDRVRLLSSPWPTDNLPTTTSSLLSVASSKGLLAAAGPDALVIATTKSVRDAFLHERAEPGTKVVSTFKPQATIPVPRVSQVSFSSNESCLVVAAEQGGGLAVYDTNALANGNAEAAFQLATEGESVRQILPNPNPAEEFSRYFVVVTVNGKLLLADLKEQKLVTAFSGSTVFHDNVTCACWSRLGKQIVAGLANGSAVQVDHQGVVKATIPEPPQLVGLRDPASSALPITSILWIETHDFLIVHTPVNPSGVEANDDSTYHLAHREKQTNTWTFSKLMDPCPPFGVERKPAHHFVQRLREWSNLSELLILASTASTDIGLFTRSKVPLDPTVPVTDIFTYTQPPEDRRAAMPLSIGDGVSDTSPIGMAMDMSATEKISTPIPNDETLDQSPVPLPALYVLNNEGMLSMWWAVYNESVRQGKPYPDLIAVGGPRPLGEQKQPQATTTPQQPATTSAFGSNSGGGSNASAQTSTFGQPSFGAPSTPAFGGASTMGNRQSPWAAPSSVATGGSQLGKPAFGQTSSFGASSFGQVGGMGANKQSVWGTPSQQQTPQQSPTLGGGSIFGGNASQQSPFANFGAKAAPSQQPAASSGSVFGGNAAQASPFMNLGSQTASSGFAGLGGGSKENKPSPFAAASKPSLPAEPSGSTVSFGNNTSFGSASTTFGVQSQPSTFGSPSLGGTFGKPSVPATREASMDDGNDTSDTASTVKASADDSKGAFGLGTGGFKLGSNFKGDGSAKDDLPKPSNPGAGTFGKSFGDTLGDASKAPSNSEGAAWLSGSGQSTPSQPQIKQEPGTESGPKLSDIPPAAPPKKEEEKKVAAPPTDDAPLPPDPTTWKPKPGALPPPIPPGFGDDFATPKQKQADPKTTTMPPQPTSGDSKQDERRTDESGSDGPFAGSPPVDLGQETFSEGLRSGSEAEGPEEGDWSDEEGEEDGDEDDESEEQATPEVTDQKGLSAFQARLTPASPKKEEAQPQGESTTPATEKKDSYTPATEKKDSYTPAGMPKAPIMFAPPQRRNQESPRSPSPVRSATSPLRSMASYSSQQPPPRPMPQPVGSRAPSSSQAPAPLPSRTSSQTQPPQRIAVPPGQLAQRQHRLSSSVRPTEPDVGDLEDEEDARIQAILSAPIEPTKDVPAFLAHQDYVASGGEKPGLGGQIERVFRDINSMIDTMALNARSLQGFTEGNRQQQDADKNRLDLEDEEAWLLGEAGKLAGVIDRIEIELEDGKLDDVPGDLEDLHDQEKDLSKLRAKMAEARKTINARRDPEQLAQQQAAGLPLESQTLQSELRQEVQKVQKLLAKAEEHLSVLRAELASLPSAQGSNGKNGAGVPTVEAVERTIMKMTQMVEQKSGDIDVLESQIRRLGGPAALGGTLNGNYEDDLAASMKASRLSHSSPAAALKASRISAHGSPAASRRGRGTPGTPGARKSLFDVSNEEVEAYRAKKDARRRAMESLKEQISERGPRVLKVGEA